MSSEAKYLQANPATGSKTRRPVVAIAGVAPKLDLKVKKTITCPWAVTEDLVMIKLKRVTEPCTNGNRACKTGVGTPGTQAGVSVKVARALGVKNS